MYITGFELRIIRSSGLHLYYQNLLKRKIHLNYIILDHSTAFLLLTPSSSFSFLSLLIYIPLSLSLYPNVILVIRMQCRIVLIPLIPHSAL